ncbi:molybdopterin oxidoreductase, iron-sulfur binding subunit, partial [mine drainage metagenome]
MILGGNPVYTAPADIDFAKLLASVPLTVHLANDVDETSEFCTWHLPECHYLENWGDARTFDGTVSIVQPMIQPIFGGRSAVEVMALVIEDPLQKAYDIVQRTLDIKSTDWRWKKALFDGTVEKTAWQPLRMSISAGNLNGALSNLIATNSAVKLDHQHLEVVFRTDSKVFDGRFANNGWLQELPDPMTRLTWDNAALINPKTGLAMGLNRHKSQIIRLKVGGRELDIATYMMPGQPENSISIALGYGRTHSGNVGNGAGFNAGAIRTTDA